MVEYEHGFEDGTLGSFTKIENLGVVTIETTQPAHGTKHAKGVSSVEAGSHRARTNYYLLSGETECYMRAYVAVISEPMPESSKQLSLAGFAGTTGGLALLQLYSTSLIFKCFYRNAGGWSRVDTDVEIEQGRYYCLEVYVKIGAGDGEARFWIDGELVGEFTELTNNDIGGLSYAESGLVLYDGSEEKIVYWDDVAIDSAYIGLIPPPPPPPTLAETMSEMINSMMSIMMVIMIMQMMTGIIKKKK